MDAATVPDLDQLDSKALKSLILELHDQVFSNQREILSQRERLASRVTEIEHLKLLIAKLRRMKFGRSSEKLDSSDRTTGAAPRRAASEPGGKNRGPPCGASRPPEPASGRTGAAVFCRIICPAKLISICRSKMRVRTAAEHCTHWVKTYRKSWSMCRYASK